MQKPCGKNDSAFKFHVKIFGIIKIVSIFAPYFCFIDANKMVEENEV